MQFYPSDNLIYIMIIIFLNEMQIAENRFHGDYTLMQPNSSSLSYFTLISYA